MLNSGEMVQEGLAVPTVAEECHMVAEVLPGVVAITMLDGAIMPTMGETMPMGMPSIAGILHHPADALGAVASTLGVSPTAGRGEVVEEEEEEAVAGEVGTSHPPPNGGR